MGEFSCNRDPKNGDSHANRDGARSSLDTRFELLADGRRRLLLRYLVDECVAEFDDCTAFVLEHDPEATPGDWKDIALELRHKHVPKLTASGVLEYDDRSEMLRYRSDPAFESLLEVVVDGDLETIA